MSLAGWVLLLLLYLALVFGMCAILHRLRERDRRDAWDEDGE